MNNTDLTEHALSEIKRHLRYLFQKYNINEPPFTLGIKDKKGVFMVNFTPYDKRKRLN